MRIRFTNRLHKPNYKAAYAIFASLGIASLLAPGQSAALIDTPTTEISIATQIMEVQRGSMDGLDYLSVNIGGHEIGPSNCRSNILRMDTGSTNDASRQAEIETIAFSAMLSSSTVMVVVPLEANECVDGKPTFTDIYLLPPME